MSKKLLGQYNHFGYVILAYDTEEDLYTEEYQAGNCYLESTTVVPKGDATAVSLDELREYCEHTGEEMAEEQGVEWLGCEFQRDAKNARAYETDVHGKFLYHGDKVDLVFTDCQGAEGEIIRWNEQGYLVVETEDGQRCYPWPQEVVKILGG